MVEKQGEYMGNETDNMNGVFASKIEHQVKSVQKYLKSLGMKCEYDYNDKIGYGVIDVEKKNYTQALEKGSNFILKNKCLETYWIDAYDIFNSDRATGHWPVVDCVLNSKKFGLDSGNYTSEWMEYDPKKPWTKEYAKKTPPEFLKITHSLSKTVKTSLVLTVTHYKNYTTLQVSAMCSHEEHRDIRRKIFDYLDKTKMFDKLTPLAVDGLRLEHLATTYNNVSDRDCEKIDKTKANPVAKR